LFRAVLTNLDLSSNQLCGLNSFGSGTYDASGINAIADALKSGRAVLTSLDLYGNQIGPEGAKALNEALGSDKTKLHYFQRPGLSLKQNLPRNLSEPSFLHLHL
jgi:hypothetical protein